MEKKLLVNFEVKASEEDGNVIEGYGSTFGNVDVVNDVVVSGAFTKSLAKQSVRMLWNHDFNQVIGKWESVTEDEKGLKVVGRFANTPKAQEVRELVKMGAVDSFSIGYRVKDFEYDAKGVRLLKEVDLFEISVVTVPANSQAMVTAVKAAEMSEREIEAILRDAGLSRSVSKALISGGYKALQTERDATVGNELKELADLLKQRIR